MVQLVADSSMLEITILMQTKTITSYSQCLIVKVRHFHRYLLYQYISCQLKCDSYDLFLAVANWHTDGASKDRVYDAVSLLCIHPSVVGGKSLVSILSILSIVVFILFHQKSKHMDENSHLNRLDFTSSPL